MKNILLIIISVLSITSYSQVELHHHDLPLIVSNDTVFCKEEIWVESVDSEIKQRHKISVMNKKLTKIRVALKHKQGYELAIDSLIIQMGDLETERDSLMSIVNTNIGNVNSEVRQQLINTTKYLKEAKSQYFILKEKKRKVAKVALISIATNILLFAVIIVII